jgi:hypothetical protein
MTAKSPASRRAPSPRLQGRCPVLFTSVCETGWARWETEGCAMGTLSRAAKKSPRTKRRLQTKHRRKSGTNGASWPPRPKGVSVREDLPDWRPASRLLVRLGCLNFSPNKFGPLVVETSDSNGATEANQTAYFLRYKAAPTDPIVFLIKTDATRTTFPSTEDCTTIVFK